MAILGPHGFLEHTATAAGGDFVTFIESNSTGSDTFSYAFASRALHASEMVFIAMAARGAQAISLTSFVLNGVPGTIVGQARHGVVAVALGYATPVAATGNIGVTWASTTTPAAMAYTTWHGSPSAATQIDFVIGTASGTTAITLTDVSIEAGGFVLAAQAGQFGSNTGSYTWSGVDTLVRRAELNVETDTLDFSAADVASTTETNTTRDMSIGASISNVRIAVAASWK